MSLDIAPGTWLSRLWERMPAWFSWGVFAASSLFSVVFYTRPGNRYGIDLDVYREAAIALFGSSNVYDLTFTPSILPFTYTPFAGLLFQVVRPFPAGAAQTLWAIASIACLYAVVRAVMPDRLARRSAAAALIAAVALWFDPVMNTMSFGQVNLFIMAAVVFDIAAIKNRRWGGVLVGAATAVKLTPGIFILYLLVSGRRREAVNAIASAAAFTLLAFAILPQETRTFFFGGTGTDPSRVGPQEFIGNQSLHGMLVRWSDAAVWGERVWLVSALVLGVLGLLLARRLDRAGHRTLAVVSVGLLGCLVSPVSWTHHFVWVVPMVVLMAYSSLPLRRRGLVQTGWVLLFLVHPIWFLPTGRGVEFGYGWWQDVVAAAYPIALIALGGWLFEAVRREERASSGGHEGVEPVASTRDER